MKEREIDAVHLAQFALRHPEHRGRIAEASEKMAEAIKAAEARRKQQQKELDAARSELRRIEEFIYNCAHPMDASECLRHSQPISTNSDGNAAE